MREGWTYKKLGEVCRITSGFTPKAADLYSFGSYPYFKVADMNTPGNEIFMSVTSSYLKDSKKYFTAQSIVFPKNGATIATNKKRILAQDSIVDLNTAIAEFSEDVISKYSYYWFVNVDFKDYMRGGALPTLDLKSLKETLIPLPPKSQQEAIVAELDEINSLLALKREQLQKYDKLAQSLFYEMFGDPVENEKGWEVKKIGEVCAPKNAVLRASKKYGFGDTIQYIDISSIDNSIQKMMGTSICKYSEAPSRAQQVVQKDDILVSLVRPNLKNVAKIDIDDINLVASSGFCVLRASNIIATEYLFMYSISDCFTNYLVSLTSGANYPAVREQDIKEAIIPLPPLSLQRQFASRIEQMESQKQQVQAAIEKLETLLASRMQYWFE